MEALPTTPTQRHNATAPLTPDSDCVAARTRSRTPHAPSAHVELADCTPRKLAYAAAGGAHAWSPQRMLLYAGALAVAGTAHAYDLVNRCFVAGVVLAIIAEQGNRWRLRRGL
ncbi:hypothetical protein WJX81_004085 [Elliptochloris bilobata]|uniref:Uncharacterized protein n=1 Tax=Elliptochloris bilobata TaxID=381761 RepID=A0AAW1SGD8_9CHLO